LASAGRAKGNDGTSLALHSYSDHPAKHAWADCSENPANQKKPVKKEQVYYAHDNCCPASDGTSNDASRRSVLSRRSGDSYADDNYAVSITSTSRKRAKC